MTTLRLRVQALGKDFNRRSVFSDISFELSPEARSIAVTGRNGSGKSTLVKIMAGVLSPSRGRVRYEEEGRALDENDVRHRIGLVSPYLQLYDEFTAWENLDLLSRMRSDSRHGLQDAERLLRQFSLWHRRDDAVRAFSSGMKQRLKYVFALLHRPDVLMLDEPTSNLDADGIAAVRDVVADQQRNGLLVVATNDADEAGWCRGRVHLG